MSTCSTPSRRSRLLSRRWSATPYDLPAIAGRYRQFLHRWDTARPLPAAPDDLARQLWLVSEWLLILRDDPRIPLRHPPPNWPAVAAEKVFHRRHNRLDPGAQEILDQAVDTVEVQVP